LPLPILLLRKRKLRHSLGRPSRSDFVQLGVTGMTVSQVMGCGVQKGTMEYEDEIHEDI